MLAALLAACAAPASVVPPPAVDFNWGGFLGGASLPKYLGAAEAGMVPAMTIMRWAKRGDQPEPPPEGSRRISTTANPGGNEAAAEALFQEANGVQGHGGVVGMRGKSLRRLLGINQRQLMAERVIPSPFYFTGLAERGSTGLWGKGEG